MGTVLGWNVETISLVVAVLAIAVPMCMAQRKKTRERRDKLSEVKIQIAGELDDFEHLMKDAFATHSYLLLREVEIGHRERVMQILEMPKLNQYLSEPTGISVDVLGAMRSVVDTATQIREVLSQSNENAVTRMLERATPDSALLAIQHLRDRLPTS